MPEEIANQIGNAMYSGADTPANNEVVNDNEQPLSTKMTVAHMKVPSLDYDGVLFYLLDDVSEMISSPDNKYPLYVGLLKEENEKLRLQIYQTKGTDGNDTPVWIAVKKILADIVSGVTSGIDFEMLAPTEVYGHFSQKIGVGKDQILRASNLYLERIANLEQAPMVSMDINPGGEKQNLDSDLQVAGQVDGATVPSLEAASVDMAPISGQQASEADLVATAETIPEPLAVISPFAEPSAELTTDVPTMEPIPAADNAILFPSADTTAQVVDAGPTDMELQQAMEINAPASLDTGVPAMAPASTDVVLDSTPIVAIEEPLAQKTEQLTEVKSDNSVKFPTADDQDLVQLNQNIKDIFDTVQDAFNRVPDLVDKAVQEYTDKKNTQMKVREDQIKDVAVSEVTSAMVSQQQPQTLEEGQALQMTPSQNNISA